MTVKYWVRDEGFADQVMKDTQKLSPYEIVDLFDEKEQEMESLRESIPSCGEIDSLNNDVDNLEIKVGILEDELQQKEQELKDAGEGFKRMTTNITNAHLKIGKLKQQIRLYQYSGG